MRRGPPTEWKEASTGINPEIPECDEAFCPLNLLFIHGMVKPSTNKSSTSKAPGIPASAQIITVMRFMGTASPRNFAKARMMRPNIELTTRYLIVLPGLITPT
jgi:hypothetical protein